MIERILQGASCPALQVSWTGRGRSGLGQCRRGFQLAFQPAPGEAGDQPLYHRVRRQLRRWGSWAGSPKWASLSGTPFSDVTWSQSVRATDRLPRQQKVEALWRPCGVHGARVRRAGLGFRRDATEIKSNRALGSLQFLARPRRILPALMGSSAVALASSSRRKS